MNINNQQKGMKNLKRNFKTQILFMAVIILVLIAIVQMVYASTKGLGSEEDPIVTLSYLELRISQLKDYIDQKSFSSDNSQSDRPEAGAAYEVVELKEGQYLIAGAGTEVILRAGRATAIEGADGDGLSDVTGAENIKQGENIPENHLLIISRDDGRGIRVLSKSYLLVRGEYTIK